MHQIYGLVRFGYAKVLPARYRQSSRRFVPYESCGVQSVSIGRKARAPDDVQCGDYVLACSLLYNYQDWKHTRKTTH